MQQKEGQFYLTSDESRPEVQSAGSRTAEEIGASGEQTSAHNVTASNIETERGTHEYEARLQTVLANLPAILCVIDRTGIITLLAGKEVELRGHGTGEAVLNSVFDLYGNAAQALHTVSRAFEGQTFTEVIEVDGRMFESRFMPVRDQHDDVTSIVCLAIDVTERLQAEQLIQTKQHDLQPTLGADVSPPSPIDHLLPAEWADVSRPSPIDRLQVEEALRESEQRFQSIMQLTLDAIITADSYGKITSWNIGAQHIFGYTLDEVSGQPLSLLMPQRFREAHQRGLDRVTATDMPNLLGHTIEIFGLRKDGSEFPIELSLASWKSIDRRYYSGIIRDISERKQAEEALRYQALHDALTDLPNSKLFLELVEQALVSAEREKMSMALLVIDLNRFKDINGTFGHQHGDLLLQQVGARLRQTLSASETLAHIGGDKFAVLLPAADELAAREVVSALQDALEEAFFVADFPLQIEASIGVVLYPAHGTTSLTLLRHADVAMYTAKSTHEGYAFYDATYDDQSSSRRLALIGALRFAITSNELALYYQPKVDLKTGASCSVEALARWQHPTYGFVPPDQFIPLAEQTGLIMPLTHWVLEAAIRQCSAWLQAGLDLGIAVNLSMWNLREAALPEAIARLLEQYNIPPRLLRLELTESSIMSDIDHALEVLLRLSNLGIRISIDDFGTGYSSLAYLKRLPVDELKIDRSFVQHMAEVETDATIVRSIVTLAHSLGLQVVAEGIEDHATWRMLSALDCDTAQGYYMSRPLPAQELERWLQNTKETVAY